MAEPVSFTPPSPEELSKQLPGFAVEELIAQGGMGAVFRGVQKSLDRAVAIKVLPQETGEKYDFAGRFEAEAKAMAKLTHNYIVGVYDYGSTPDGSLLYFVMEYVDGTSLHDAIHSGEWELTHKVALLARVCEAVQFAHESGVVHRDIKPANILIDKSWNPKVTDFGLASIKGGPEHDVIFGTPGYFPPECKGSGSGDFRVDIFALGALVYETLTSIPPDESSAPPSLAAPGVPQEFDAVVARAMHPMAGQRYSSAGEMGEALLAAYEASKAKARAKSKSAKLIRPVTPPPGATAPAPTRRVAGGAPKSSGRGTGFLWLALFIVLGVGGATWMIIDKLEEERSSKGGTTVKPDPGGSAVPVFGQGLGSLRAFGSWPGDEAVDLRAAGGHRDFWQVGAFRNFAYALRDSGELVSLKGGKKLEDIKSLSGHSLWASIITDDDRAIQPDGSPVEVAGLEKVKMVAAGASHAVVLLPNGTVKVWGEAYDSPGTMTGPPRPLSNVSQVAAAADAALVVDRSGKVFAWRTDDMLVREVKMAEPVIEARGGSSQFVLLTKTGKVYQLDGQLTEVTQPGTVGGTSGFVAVRGGGSAFAAQRRDGTWVAWAPQPQAVIDRVNSLPPTYDLSLYVDPGGGFGSVLWVER